MNTLAGFDLVFAVTQQTINHQLAMLSAFEVIPSTWQVNSDDPTDPPALEATLGLPFIDLVNAGDASGRMILVHFPILSGTFRYFEIDTKHKKGRTPIVIAKEAVMDGWDLSFKVNLDLANLEQRLIAQNVAIPPEVKQQLTAFDESMFDISHLFLNFEDANLVDSFNVKELNTNVLSTPEAIGQFKDYVSVLLKQLQGSDNPFILGYTVTNKPSTDSTAIKPTFEPTGTNYSAYPEPAYPSRSTLNYLLMTQDRLVPVGPGYGIFNHNWVNTDDIQGTFVISQTLVMNQILPTIASTLGADASQFSQNSNSFSLTVGNSYGSSTTCTVVPIPGTNQVSISFVIYVRQDIHDGSIFHSYVGYVDGYIAFSSTLTLNLDAAGSLNVSVANGAPDSSHLSTHRNGLGDFEAGLAQAADTIRQAFGSDAIYQNMIRQDWSIAVGGSLLNAITNLKQRIVLPAGNVFFFKNAVFSSEGHLMLTTTYKN